ncbi:MAG: hypothetical protein OEZ22_02215 [Spirochaetia bacterium]|nr:hypothetical protein [Spirochaetia bacterium]
MELQGYSSQFLIVLLFLGILLIIIKPYYGFLYIVFWNAAADYAAFTLTRFSFLGPFFNAHDACLLIGIIALAAHIFVYNKKLIIPNIVIWIFIVLLIGFFQSIIIIGWEYEIIRSLRWAVSLPVYMIIAVNIIDKEEKINLFLLVLFIGSLASALNHIIFVQEKISLSEVSSHDINLYRTIAFRNPGLWILLTGLFYLPKNLPINRIYIWLAALLFAISTLLNQTRSIWIASIFSLIPLIFLFPQKKSSIKLLLIPFSIFFLYMAMQTLSSYIFPNFNVDNIITSRISTLIEESDRAQSTITRQLSYKREMEEYMKGTLIFGKGLSFYMPFVDETYGSFRVAWGHLGHITTLAQFGIIGLFIYSFYFPFKIIKISRELWKSNSEVIKFISILAGLIMIWNWICFLMSDSFLTIHNIDAIIFGTAIGLYIINTKKIEDEKNYKEI